MPCSIVCYERHKPGYYLQTKQVSEEAETEMEDFFGTDRSPRRGNLESRSPPSVQITAFRIVDHRLQDVDHRLQVCDIMLSVL